MPYGTLYCVLWHFVVGANPACLVWFTGIIYSISIPCNGVFEYFVIVVICKPDNLLFCLSSYGGKKTVYCRKVRTAILAMAILKFLHRTKLGLLQDRGRFQISPIFQMKLNFSTEIFCGSHFKRPARKDVGRYQGQ